MKRHLEISAGFLGDIALMMVVDVVAVGLGQSLETLATHEEDLHLGQSLAGSDVARLLQQRFEEFAVLEQLLLLLQGVDVVAEDHLRLARVQHVERDPHFVVIQQIRFGPRHLRRAVEEVAVELVVIVDSLLDQFPVAVFHTGQVGEQFQQYLRQSVHIP